MDYPELVVIFAAQALPAPQKLLIKYHYETGFEDG
jgi:hypothetical protein